jgi:hypothetical protein
MSAVDEYRKRQAPYTALDGAISMQLADAAIAELEAEVERLKCCGNCGRWGLLGLEVESASICRHMLTQPSDTCHFAPSRWQPREEAK